MKKGKGDALAYILLTVFAVAAVILGCRYTTKGAMLFTGQTSYAVETYLTKVDVVLNRRDSEISAFGGEEIDTVQTEISFTCTCVFGERKGECFVARQNYDRFIGKADTPAEPGDLIFIYNTEEGSNEYLAGNFFRIKTLAILFAIMVAFLMLFSKLKGVATMLSLGLTLMSLFFVFVPAILSGFNIYLWTIIICVYSISITPPFVGGFNKKSLASIVGCIMGVVMAAGLTMFLIHTMKITGIVTEEDIFVVQLLHTPLDMQAITFAATIIGALGSTMDVSMSIAASVWEMNESRSGNSFKSLLQSGFNIGRDILGTQISTLVLAYIGSSLCTVLLYVAYQPSLMQMLNVEAVIVEILDALVGAATIILTIPFTALVSALMLAGEKRTLISENMSSFRIGH